jgi:hypothetical protein
MNTIKTITLEQFETANVGTKFCESFGSNYQFFRLVKNQNNNLDGETNHYNYENNSWVTRVVKNQAVEKFINDIEFQLFD